MLGAVSGCEFPIMLLSIKSVERGVVGEKALFPNILGCSLDHVLLRLVCFYDYLWILVILRVCDSRMLICGLSLPSLFGCRLNG